MLFTPQWLVARGASEHNLRRIRQGATLPLWTLAPRLTIEEIYDEATTQEVKE